MENKILFSVFLLSFSLFLGGCVETPIKPQTQNPIQDKPVQMQPTSFLECEAAGGDIAESYPRQCFLDDLSFTEEVELPVENEDNLPAEADMPSENETTFTRGYAQICKNNDGVWIEDQMECEGLSREVCEDFGGEFDGCASACRNDPEAQMCTMNCVLVCSFAGDVQKQAACEAEGGSWEEVGKLGLPDCIYHYADAGLRCESSDDCEGECIVTESDGSNPHCAADSDVFGCHSSVEEFEETGGILCVD